MRVQFFLGMNPPTITAQEHRIRMVKKNVTRSDGKTVQKQVPVVYEDERLKDARQKLMASLAKWKYDMKFSGMPDRNGVRLETVWCFPIRDGSKYQDGDYRTTKPDTDNLQKMLKDCMTAVGLWKDDALVCSEHVEKRWSVNPGIFIVIEDIESWQLREAGLTDEQIEEFEGLKDAEVMWLPYQTNGTGLPL